MLEKRVQKGKEIEILKSVQTLSERKDVHDNLEQKWKQESGKRDVLIWLFMKPTENLSLKDWSCIKLINGLIRSERKDEFMWKNWK